MAETSSKEEPLTCVSYGTSQNRDYAFVPNIAEQSIDSERKRVVKESTWQPVFIEVSLNGKMREFAVKPSKKLGSPNILYKEKEMRYGLPGEPIGEYVEIMEDGISKKKFKFYKKNNII